MPAIPAPAAVGAGIFFITLMPLVPPAGSQPLIQIIGGGLAGPEAAWQAARRGLRVRLLEMRPHASTPAHRTSALGELVCSNSLKSEAPHSAPWLLKQELRQAGSLLLDCAAETAIPGGQALTVDRQRFSAAIESRLRQHSNIELVRDEVRQIPRDGLAIVATGPLTSSALAEDLARLTGSQRLYFYDAISPVVEDDSIDYSRAWRASRHGKGGEDYLNCPLDRGQYQVFHQALLGAESYPLHDFEPAQYFEACLPLEELARRGPETLRYGPMKPVGLRDPRTGQLPYAVVQLRREDARAGAWNLVGFQNHLRFAEQARVLRLIPALEHAVFLRFGQVHRNTYLNAPALLDDTLALRRHPNLWIAGQLCGTEGYVEAIATGFLAGVHAARAAWGLPPAPPPRATALGSLINYMQKSRPEDYTPANITFDLLPSLDPPVRDRALRHQAICESAMRAMAAWWEIICHGASDA